MSAQHVLYLLSTTGAAAFFAAGYAANRLRRRFDGDMASATSAALSEARRRAEQLEQRQFERAETERAIDPEPQEPVAGEEGTDLRRRTQELEALLAEAGSLVGQREEQLAAIQAALARAEASARNADALKAENGRLLEELELMRAELESAQPDTGTEATNQGQRLEVELLRRRISELEASREERAELLSRLQEAEGAGLEASLLRIKLGELEARLAAVAAGGSPALVVAGSTDDPPPSATALAQTLRTLVTPDGAQCAALAEQHGLPVEVAGDASLLDGLAAVSGLASRMARQAEELLPLNDVSEVALLDAQGRKVLCRLFTCAGDAMAVVVYGLALPPKRAIDGVVGAVLQTMGFAADEWHG